MRVLAYQALQGEINLGLLLPRNAVVYERDGQVCVGAVDVAKMLSVVGVLARMIARITGLGFRLALTTSRLDAV